MIDESEEEEELSKLSPSETKEDIESKNLQKDDEFGDLAFEDEKLAEDIEIDENDEDIKDISSTEKDIDLIDEDENLEEITSSKQDKIEEISEEDNIKNNHPTVQSVEELDMIDEKSLKELFGQNIDEEEMQEVNSNEEEMEVESFEEIKPKKKKKKKNKKNILNQEALSSLQEEITSKLLDIDTLREVLDGMEIRIKFYNKNKGKS